MRYQLTLCTFLVCAATIVSAGDKYPLTMNAVFTKGHSVNVSKDATFQSGDYMCTKGDENHAPDCRTLSEWARMDAIAGEPDTVVFTLADGSQVGVQSRTLKKIPGYVVCDAGTSFIFCSLYFDFLERQQVNPTKGTQYGQTEYMTGNELQAAQEARNRELFGQGNTMTLPFRYKLKGKAQDGFQRIEVDKASCITDEHKINACGTQDVTHLLNSRGDGYIVNAKVEGSVDRTIQPSNNPLLVGLKENSAAAQSSAASANLAASIGHVPTKEEIAQMLKEGKASTVAVITNPPGADIFVDQNKIGRSPMVFNLVRLPDQPERTIKIEMAGYKTVEKKITPDGNKVPIGIDLQKETP